jgi:hypothetical protein
LSKKDADQLVKDLRGYFREAGLDLTIEKRGGHWHVVNPDGKSIGRFASTPSIDRFRRNTITDLRQRGILPRDWR